jgi:pyruvate formate lyase activating enzyme
MWYAKAENIKPRFHMKAIVTNIQGFSIHDGPGIRTVVFLKGCPLRCRWCANPEGLNPNIQIGFIDSLCVSCGKCFFVCPENALRKDSAGHRIDYDRCTACGKCTEVCNYSALVRYGAEMSADEVVDVVSRDKMFYDTSGGGVTVSGGEPILHASFVKALFEKCRDAGINTCVETSGCIPSNNLLEVLPLTDYLLFDLKHLNSDLHKRYTGQSNGVILENAIAAVKSTVPVLFRMPLIPSINDTPENIREPADFIKSLTPDPQIQLMPYHRLGESKYKALNRSCVLRDLQVMSRERIEEVRQAFLDLGVNCTVSR